MRSNAQHKGNEQVEKEPASGLTFPKAMTLSYGDGNSGGRLNTLVGIGIRQVTFMGFNAYAMGLYLDSESLDKIKAQSRWTQEFKAGKLTPSNPESTFFLSSLLQDGQPLTLVVQTCRTTDAPHLRNGFIKFLTNRLHEEKLPLAEREQVLEKLDAFRSDFPAGSFKQGYRIFATRLSNGHLRMSFPDHPLTDTKTGGSNASERFLLIQDERLSRWFFEGYLRGPRPISPSLLESVSQGLESQVR